MAKARKKKSSKLAKLGRRLWSPAKYGLLQKEQKHLTEQLHETQARFNKVKQGFDNFKQGKRLTREARKLFSGDLPHPETITTALESELFNLQQQQRQLERELSAVRVQKKIIEKARQKESK